ncbi:hypothetical protein AAHE18_18G039200 [Arachis hypogaea]
MPVPRLSSSSTGAIPSFRTFIFLVVTACCGAVVMAPILYVFAVNRTVRNPFSPLNFSMTIMEIEKIFLSTSLNSKKKKDNTSESFSKDCTTITPIQFPITIVDFNSIFIGELSLSL